MNFHNKKGFTFIEVMVAMTILSVSLVAILRSYVVVLDEMGYLTGRVYASAVLDNQIEKIERDLRVYRTLPLELNNTIKIDTGHKIIVFTPLMKISALSGFNNVFQLDLTLEWAEGAKTKSIQRSAYITDAGLATPTK